MKKVDVDFSSAYSLRIMRNDKIHGFVSWFDCIFEDPNHPEKRVVLSTNPGKHGTHWKQTTFYMDLKDSMSMLVKRDDILSGSIACLQSKNNFRELNVKISFYLKRALDKDKPDERAEVYAKTDYYKVR